MPLVFAAIVGVASGFLIGGSFRSLAHLKLRFELVLVAVLIIQGVARGRLPGTVPHTWGLAIWCASSVVLVACLGANWRIPGALVAAAGTVLNVDVTLSNLGMPVTVPGGSGLSAVASLGGFYRAAHSGTLLVWAGDVIPLRLMGQQFMVSSGDIALAVGVIVMLAHSMRSPSIGMIQG